MIDQLKHECGIALIRLRKPLDWYHEKYGTERYGINKLCLLMEKQHNRGQDGTGIVNIKLNVSPGNPYISRIRSAAPDSLTDIFNKINSQFAEAIRSQKNEPLDAAGLKKNLPFTGELFLGHLRYGTFGNNGIDYCHPFLRQNNWMTRNLAVAGNFNLTNVDELFQQLLELGQHPKQSSDTVTVLEKIGHFLDEENDLLYYQYKDKGLSKKEITPLIAQNIDWQRILSKASKDWDGGYTIAGLAGHGDAFVMRDPSGIRPAFYYVDDEVVVVTSERPAIQTAFNVPLEEIKEVGPGKALIIKKDGSVSEVECRKPLERKSCSFERIYFSRGSDADIYRERQKLGELLVPSVLESIGHDVNNTVFSFIPNTAEVAFYGLIKGVEGFLNTVKKDKIRQLGNTLSDNALEDILALKPRVEKIAIKDAKLRTFITSDLQRNELVAHVYDVTYGTVRKGEDNLVIIDDSIVRGTTLKKSILKILDRLGPKKIVFVSSAPQIRYPDCYGIDMAKIGDLVAFRAAEALLNENNMEDVLDKVYYQCLEELNKPKEKMINAVKEIYRPFTPQQISNKIAELIRPADISSEVQVIFQSIEELHKACPGHLGDWYFTGDYPTPGGIKVVNRAYVNYREGKNVRAY